MTKARDLGKLVSQGQPLADGTVQASEVSGLAVVATSGSYNDLLNKPTNLGGGTTDYNQLTNKPTFATVATSGSYNDLINKPTLFSGSYTDLTNKPTLFSGSYNDLTDKPTSTPGTFSGSYTDLTNKPTLFSGSYTDLTNKPTFATVATSGSYTDLINTPTLFSGSYTDLTNTPTLFSGSYTDLTNKPTLFSGSYTDLTNKPTLFSGSYTDLTDKPTLATVATTGSYNDLLNKPATVTLKGTSITYAGDDLAADPAGGQTILVVGTGFEATPTVYVGGTIASSVSFVSSTQITFTAPPKPAGTYDVYIVNPGGATAIMVMAISYSGVPAWTTAAGSLGTVEGTVNVQLQATSNSAITYTLASGSTLPSGVTLSSTGLLSGTIASDQTFSFTVVATDAENQDTSRSFQVTVSTVEPFFKNVTLLLAANGPSPIIKNYTVINSGASDYLIDGVSDPTITLIRGSTYTFTVNASGHPFWIKTSQVTGTGSAYSTGVTNNGTQSGTVTFVVPNDAPDTLYYICQFHGSMSGTINIINAATNNNTFIDNSINNFAITRNGNVSQGTFTPYGSNWSNYFENGSSRLITANTANWQFGTGDFTVEAFVFLDSISGYGIFVKCSDDGSWNNGWTLNHNNGQLELWINNSVGSPIVGGSITVGAWHHVAATRSGTTVRLFVNGTVTATATNSTNITSTNTLTIAGENGTVNYPAKGYISNVRVNKGTALYTSNFVPATTPLTAVSGTVLLTCQGNRFVDRSSSAVSLTITGTPRVERLSPFNPTTSYAAGTIGGSGCFDAINDTLTTATSANLNLGTGAFQIDFWMYTTASPGQYMGPFGTNNAGGTGGIFFANRGGNLDFTNNYDTAGAISAPFPSLNEWHHIVVVRNSSNVRAYYVDGVRVGSLSNPVDFNQTQFILGAYNASFGGWAGYISDFRVIVGTNIVDPNLTTIAVPTAPSTAVTGTQLLLNFTNAGIIDNAMMNDLETVGNAQISTAQSKFGGGSLYFDGTGDWLKASTGRIADFGTGDFTIEAWVYLLSHDGDQSAVFAGGLDFTSFTQPNVNIDTTGTVNLNGNQPTSNALSLNTWTHIAVSRSSGTCRIFINGVQGSSASNTLNYNGIGCYVGVRVGGSVYGDINGYIDDLRITKGYARYTANFTPPTSAHKLR
jgi:hypothetical protein